jgi:hypothetical protein
MIHSTHAGFSVQAARPDQIAEARAFAAFFIGDKVATAETLAWVHERSGASLFLAHEDGRLAGVWAALLLSEAGVRACYDDTFDGLEPDPAHVARRTEEPAGVYAWGIACATKDTARRLIAASDAVDAVALAHLHAFTRPVTEAGMRLAQERKGFRPVEGTKTGLFWVGPRRAQPEVAA